MSQPARFFLLFVSISTLLVSTPMFAQTGVPVPPAASNSGQGATPDSFGTTPAQAPAKKLWTNDDFTGSRAGEVSSPPASRAKSAPGAAKTPNSAGQNAKWYHDQIAKLQDQLPSLDGQIAELQGAIDGKPTGDGKTSQRPRGVKADDWSVELAQLRARRDDVASKINALRDQARHRGIPDRDLP